uniref:Uncharacterized protein n=1 Tax=Pristionchus pacificus TaxID=54126 RepID=A0A8R1YW65_PRIPA
MEPLHQLHSSTYEVMYPYKVHYQACSSDSSEGYDDEKTMIERERTIITDNEWAMRVMQSNQMNSFPPSSPLLLLLDQSLGCIPMSRRISYSSGQCDYGDRTTERGSLSLYFPKRDDLCSLIHNTLQRDKAHDKIRWHEGEMKKMGLGMVTSFYLFVHIINAFFAMLDRSRTLVSALRNYRSSVSTRKSVRFADSLGLDLEKMEYFTRDEENLFAHTMPSV